MTKKSTIGSSSCRRTSRRSISLKKGKTSKILDNPIPASRSAEELFFRKYHTGITWLDCVGRKKVRDNLRTMPRLSLRERHSKNLSLPNVTLVCVTGVNYPKSIFALKRSLRRIEFSEALLVGKNYKGRMPAGIKYVEAKDSALDSIDAYSEYCIYKLWSHIKSSHILLIQADGYVLNPKQWSPENLKYDYIGAPWEYSENAYIDPFGNHQRVGNGGFSLRSLKLLKVPQLAEVPWEINNGDFYKHMDAGLYSEDGNICVHNRHIYESAGCVFAPLEIAMTFSKEKEVVEFDGRLTFGFHKKLPRIVNHLREKAAWVTFLFWNRHE